MKALWLAAALAVSAAAPSPGAAAEGAVSPGVEERLDAMLTDILGHGRGRAFVRLVPLPPDVTAPPAQPDEEAPAALWERMAERVRRAPPVLPGFPAPRSLREEALRELVGPAPPAPAPAPEPASALAVTLVVDYAVGDDELKAATDAVARALGLAAERGDTLRAARAPLAPTLAKSLGDPGLRSAAAAGGTAGLLVLAGLLVVALALGARAPVFVRVEAPAAPPPAPFAPAPALPPAPGAAAPAPAPAALPPLGAGGAAACAELLRDGPAAAADWLLRRATAEEAAAVYARLPGPVRLGAALLLADAEGFAPPAADAASLALRATHRVLGLERLEDILLRVGPDARAEAAESLRLAAPAAAARLKALPLFADLTAAAADDLRLCLSPFSSARLAAALAPEPAPVRAAFLDVLPGVAADLVRERLGAEPAGGASAQGEVLARWRRLERAGRVRPLGESASRTELSP